MSESLPEYVQRSIRTIKRSEEVLAESGNPLLEGTESPEEAAKNFDELWDASGDEPLLQDDGRRLVHNPYVDVPQVAMNDSVIKEVKYRCDVGTMSYLYNFIDNLRLRIRAGKDGDGGNQLTESEYLQQLRVPDQERMPVPVADQAAKEQFLQEKYLSVFSNEQREAFGILRNALSNSESKQVIMMLTGEGDTGKSDVIHAIRLQTQLIAGKVRGYRGACVNMAPTGAAAFNIKGNTWQSCLEKSNRESYAGITSISSKTQQKLETAYIGARVVIIDEVSMLALESLLEISDRYTN